jgi:hypothetical protein
MKLIVVHERQMRINDTILNKHKLLITIHYWSITVPFRLF